MGRELTAEITGAWTSTKEFAVESVRFLNKCTKPDRKGPKFIIFLFSMIYK